MAIRGDRFSGSSNILKIAPFDTLLEKGKRKGVEICATLPIWGGLLPVDAILPPGSFSTATRSWTHRCPSTDASVPSNVARARDCLSLSCAIASDELNKVPRETMHCAADKSKNLFLFFFFFLLFSPFPCRYIFSRLNWNVTNIKRPKGFTSHDPRQRYSPATFGRFRTGLAARTNGSTAAGTWIGSQYSASVVTIQIP